MQQYSATRSFVGASGLHQLVVGVAFASSGTMDDLLSYKHGTHEIGYVIPVKNYFNGLALILDTIEPFLKNPISIFQ